MDIASFHAGTLPGLSDFDSDFASASPQTRGPASRKRARRDSSAAAPSCSVSVQDHRHSSPSNDSPLAAANRRKSQKISRACDFCKQRKIRCSGTLPCAKCVKRNSTCLYDTSYSRGRPPTPPPSTVHAANTSNGVNLDHAAPVPGAMSAPRASVGNFRPSESHGLVSRASPELGMAEIEGHVFDPTSGVSFLHRAWRRLTKKRDSAGAPPDESLGYGSAEKQPGRLVGDRPLPQLTDADVYRLTLPNSRDTREMMALYFDVCIATYRIIHRPSTEAWLGVMESNLRQGKPAWNDIGKPKAAVVLACLAISAMHNEKSRGFRSKEEEAASLARCDHFFCVSSKLIEMETGLPRVESTQARIIQTLYLLVTSRMDRAWFVFGMALQLISAQGLHRKAAEKRNLATTTGTASTDYIQTQCRIRTFWAAYVLDGYLGVLFGRPRHYHDEDIDQAYPDRVDDEDMTAQGPLLKAEDQGDCYIDALIFHAKIARIIGNTSREVYSTKPISESERAEAAHRLNKDLHDWRSSLPPHLGTVRPSMLLPSFRRQSTVLKFAYWHAMMHANRLFLLGNMASGDSGDGQEPTQMAEAQILECVGAARAVLETVDHIAAEGPIFHAFWWIQYVTFCALIVSYVWDIQLKRRGAVPLEEDEKHAQLMKLTEKCQMHLANATATNSPSRRYAIILEEFRSEAMGQRAWPKQHGVQSHEAHAIHGSQLASDPDAPGVPTSGTETGDVEFSGQGDVGVFGPSLLDEWQTMDWLDLDSSAFKPFMDMELSPLEWIPDMDI